MTIQEWLTEQEKEWCEGAGRREMEKYAIADLKRCQFHACLAQAGIEVSVGLILYDRNSDPNGLPEDTFTVPCGDFWLRFYGYDPTMYKPSVILTCPQCEKSREKAVHLGEVLEYVRMNSGPCHKCAKENAQKEKKDE